jgi:hypothetical protein
VSSCIDFTAREIPLEFNWELKFESRVDLRFFTADWTASLRLGACGGGSTAPRGGQAFAKTDGMKAHAARTAVGFEKSLIIEKLNSEKIW